MSPQPEKVMPIPGGVNKRSKIGDIPNWMLQTGTRSRDFPEPDPDPRFDKQLGTIQSKIQAPDWETLPFDVDEYAVAVPAGQRINIVQFKLEQNIEGVLEKFGWYTTAGGADDDLLFSLEINGIHFLPGGRFISGSAPENLNNYNPSAGTIDYDKLAKAPIYIPSSATVTIKVQNQNAVIGYTAWGRLAGRHWPVSLGDPKAKSYYNREKDGLK